MTGPPLIDLSGVVKQSAALRSLRVQSLSVAAGDRLVLSGFDAEAAEMLVHLVTGAALPDTGSIRIAGRDTREVATDREWLASLDRFGLVTERAILLDHLSVRANLALPLTLSIDPMAPDVRRAADALAEAVGLPAGRLDDRASSLDPLDRVRVHLARAVALGPELVILEHPTARLAGAASETFGRCLVRVADARQIGWLAISEDARFAAAVGGRRLRLRPSTGVVATPGWFR